LRYEIFKNNGKITTQDSSKTIIMKKYTSLHNNSKCFFINIYAQNAKLTLADKNMRVICRHIKTYERIAEKGYKSVDLFQKLGNAYYFNSEFDKAAKWYGELFALDSSDFGTRILSLCAVFKSNQSK
jgi:tetratricopeptide (TPR) repeat protein